MRNFVRIRMVALAVAMVFAMVFSSVAIAVPRIPQEILKEWCVRIKDDFSTCKNVEPPINCDNPAIKDLQDCLNEYLKNNDSGQSGLETGDSQSEFGMILAKIDGIRTAADKVGKMPVGTPDEKNVKVDAAVKVFRLANEAKTNLQKIEQGLKSRPDSDGGSDQASNGGLIKQIDTLINELDGIINKMIKIVNDLMFGSSNNDIEGWLKKKYSAVNDLYEKDRKYYDETLNVDENENKNKLKAAFVERDILKEIDNALKEADKNLKSADGLITNLSKWTKTEFERHVQIGNYLKFAEDAMTTAEQRIIEANQKLGKEQNEGSKKQETDKTALGNTEANNTVWDKMEEEYKKVNEDYGQHLVQEVEGSNLSSSPAFNIDGETYSLGELLNKIKNSFLSKARTSLNTAKFNMKNAQNFKQSEFDLYIQNARTNIGNATSAIKKIREALAQLTSTETQEEAKKKQEEEKKKQEEAKKQEEEAAAAKKKQEEEKKKQEEAKKKQEYVVSAAQRWCENPTPYNARDYEWVPDANNKDGGVCYRKDSATYYPAGKGGNNCAAGREFSAKGLCNCKDTYQGSDLYLYYYSSNEYCYTKTEICSFRSTKKNHEVAAYGPCRDGVCKNRPVTLDCYH